MTVISDASPVTFSGVLPEAVDVVIIGGGILGVSTAWFLAGQGVSVLLCEKGRIAGEQSSRNWGWVRQQGRDPAELSIMQESLRIWDRLSADTGADYGFAKQGVLYLAESEERLGEFENWLMLVEDHKLDSRMLSAADVTALLPDCRGAFKGGLFTPSDGRAEPEVAVPNLARAAQAQGAVILECCAVRTLDAVNGAVKAVITEKGPVRCGAVLLAGGAWSSLFLRNQGISLPQLSVKATVARTAPGPSVFEGNASTSEFAFRRRQDGGYTIALSGYHEHYLSAETFRHFFSFLPSYKASWRETKLRILGSGIERGLTTTERWNAGQTSPFERTRVMNPLPDRQVLRRLRQHLAARLPRLADQPFVESWSGMIDSTPDLLPIMDSVAPIQGLFLATGFSGHGFGIGPGAGRVMADLIRGRDCGHDLKPFRLARFEDGSPVRLGPAL